MVEFMIIQHFWVYFGLLRVIEILFFVTYCEELYAEFLVFERGLRHPFEGDQPKVLFGHALDVQLAGYVPISFCLTQPPMI